MRYQIKRTLVTGAPGRVVSISTSARRDLSLVYKLYREPLLKDSCCIAVGLGPNVGATAVHCARMPWVVTCLRGAARDR